jgi:hypothetical protein
LVDSRVYIIVKLDFGIEYTLNRRFLSTGTFRQQCQSQRIPFAPLITVNRHKKPGFDKMLWTLGHRSRNRRLHQKSPIQFKKLQTVPPSGHYAESSFYFNLFIGKHNVTIRNLWERVEGKPRDELFDVVLEVAAFARQHLLEAKKY